MEVQSTEPEGDKRGQANTWCRSWLIDFETVTEENTCLAPGFAGTKSIAKQTEGTIIVKLDPISSGTGQRKGGGILPSLPTPAPSIHHSYLSASASATSWR